MADIDDPRFKTFVYYADIGQVFISLSAATHPEDLKFLQARGFAPGGWLDERYTPPGETSPHDTSLSIAVNGAAELGIMFMDLAAHRIAFAGRGRMSVPVKLWQDLEAEGLVEGPITEISWDSANQIVMRERQPSQKHTEKRRKYLALPKPIQQNGKWGYQSPDGTIVTPCEYDRAEVFYKSRGIVWSNGLAAIVDQTGKLLTPCQFRIAAIQSDSKILIDSSPLEHTFVDLNGQRVWTEINR